MRYADLSLDEAAQAAGAGRPVLLPLAALEPTSTGGQLGASLAGVTDFCDLLSTKISGVVLPPLTVSVLSGSKYSCLALSTKTFGLLLDDCMSGLLRTGFSTLLIVCGDASPAQEIEVYEAALRTMDDHPGVRVFAGTKSGPGGESGTESEDDLARWIAWMQWDVRFLSQWYGSRFDVLQPLLEEIPPVKWEGEQPTWWEDPAR